MDKNPVIIFEDMCKACGICYSFCPSKTIGSDENGKVIIVAKDKCIRCGLCEAHCPDYAIILRRDKIDK